MTLLLHGISVSRGISIGPVHLLERGKPEIMRYSIPRKRIQSEVSRFKKAHQQAIRHLQKIKDSIPKNAPEDIAAFIDSHLLMMDDFMLGQVPAQIIEKERCNAEWALKHQEGTLIKVFDEMQDSYLKTRRNDIEHIIHLIQSFLHDENYDIKPHKNLKDHIIVTDDLTPADMIMFERQKIAGFITEYGGPTSHTAILARSFGIPCIVAVPGVRALLSENETVIMDSVQGLILAGGDKYLLAKYREQKRLEKSHQQKLASLKDKKARTNDGVRIILMANIELGEDIRTLKRCGSDGVGLYRTEFLYIDRNQAATEQEQFTVYKKIIRAAGDNPVTIRTLDLGAEKEFDPEYTGPLAPNPALGLRAIRRSLKSPQIFLAQLRAIFRASAYGKVRLLIPMLTSPDELEQILQLCELVKEQLTKSGKRFDSDMMIGGMIEVPAAALAAEEIGRRLDFLSLGTNDLIQYALAVDRIDEEVSYLYDPLHPGILRLIGQVINAGKNLNIPVAMCGEMASDIRFTRLLLGMGLREFSVHPNDLPEIKNIIINSNISRLKRQYKRALNSGKPEQIKKFASKSSSF